MERKFMITSPTLIIIAERLEAFGDTQSLQVAAACRGLADGMCHDDGICGDGETTWYVHGV